MLYAYTVMSEHIHILLRPINNELSKTMQLIKGRSSRHINKGTLWQKGFFDFLILTEEKFKEKFNYIHYNPVKRGLVERAEDYKYSSAMGYKVKYGEVFYK
jgi:putative transposase